MSTLLAVFSYPGANQTLARHYPYFQLQAADWLYGIGTRDGVCEFPEGMREIKIGDNRYIDGPHLPNRMLDTIEKLLSMPWDELILTEYDTVFFRAIELDYLWTAAGHHAGGAIWGSKAKAFYHNPWAFRRTSAQAFLDAGREAIAAGICPGRERGAAPTAESSPDVFFGYVCESIKLPVQTDLWSEYSRNSFDIPGHLEEARAAYRSGVHCIHGIKRKEELDFILA